MLKNKKGMTLIELLAVIAIIAILFILLIPRINSAIDKSKISGVQTDLHSYEIAMRSYFMEHRGEAKSFEGLNKYLDKSLKIEKIEEKHLAISKNNPYGEKYELFSDWETYMQINSYTNEKDPRIHGVRVYEEDSEEIESIYIGFKDKKTKSSTDTEAPIINISVNGGENVSTTLNVTDNTAVFTIGYAWSKDESFPSSGWIFTTDGTTLDTNELKKGKYYLHIKSSDLEGNTSKFTSNLFIVGDNEAPVINISKNGSGIDYKNTYTTVVTVTDNKKVENVQYIWSNTTTRITDRKNWITINSGDSLTTPVQNGSYYLHVIALDDSQNESYFVSEPFNIDFEAPKVSLSLNGNLTLAKNYSTKITATDNFALKNIKYKWMKEGGTNITSFAVVNNNTTVTTPSAQGKIYLEVVATDMAGNETTFKSNLFNVDNIAPTLTSSGFEDRNLYSSTANIVNLIFTLMVYSNTEPVENIQSVTAEVRLGSTSGIFVKTDTDENASFSGTSSISEKVKFSSYNCGSTAYLTAKITDKAGNVGTLTKTAKITCSP